MRILIALAAAGLSFAGLADSGVLTVAVPRECILAEKTAARELAEYLGKMTGRRVEVASEDRVNGTVAVHLGATEFAKAQIPDIGRFGKEEWAVLARDGALVLAGGRPRGTLYAVYHYLEDVAGVRWLTPATDHVPAHAELPHPKGDMRGKPAMPYREIYDVPGESGQRFLARNRMNVSSAEYGGGRVFGGSGGSHTLYTNMGGPDEIRRLFKEHPDWFPLIDGKRTCHLERANGQAQSQLCLTNPELRRYWTDKLRERIRADRATCRKTGQDFPLYYAIDQNDSYDGFCRCPACLEIFEREGSNSGILLDFANYVAAALEGEAQDARFAMMALHSTEKPPKSLKARHNVVIRLCDTTSNMVHPWTAAENAPHLANLREWTKHADAITMWDYSVTYWAPSVVNLPTPAERTFAPDIRLLRDSKGAGFFFEHENPIAADLRDLKVWLEIKLVENPDLDDRKLTEAFTDLYYGPEAGAAIRRYRELLGEAADKAGASVRWFPNLSDYAFLDASCVGAFYALRNEAIHAVRGDSERTMRVANAFSSLDRYYLLRAATLRRQAEKSGAGVVLPDWDAVAERYRLVFEGEKVRRGYTSKAAAEQRAVTGLFEYLDKAKELPVPEIFKDVPEDALRLFPATFAIRHSSVIEFVPDPDSPAGSAVTANMLLAKKNDRPGYRLENFPWPLRCAVWPTMAGTVRCTPQDLPPEQPKGYRWYRLGGRFKLTAESKVTVCPGFYIPLDGVISDNSELGQEYEVWISLKVSGPDIWKAKVATEDTIFAVDQVAVVRKTLNGADRKRPAGFKVADAVVVKARVEDKGEASRLAFAADELTNAICKTTGRMAPVFEEGSEPADACPAIYIGPSAAARAAGIDGAGMRNGDWRVKCADGRVFLYGKTAYSATRAVFDFMEKVCDYHVLTVEGDDVFTFNPGLEAAACDRTTRPAIYGRSVYHAMYDSKKYPTVKKYWERFGMALGLEVPRTIEGDYRVSLQVKNCHSSFCYLPPEKWFAEHPEYYSMGPDGKRHGIENAGSQLCYTNPDTYRLVLESLERFVAADRAANPADPPLVYDFTQGDNSDFLCLCPECSKVIAKYDREDGGHKDGGDAGLQLEFVNRLARDIRKKYPGVQLRTFAYVSTERAPKPGTISVEPNVRIWWCDVYSHSDHTIPLRTPGHYNERQAREFEEWRQLTGNIEVWDYMLSGGAMPEVAPDAIKADAAFFAESGVPMLFMEMEFRGQPLYDLNAYLMSKLYVDPSLDVDALIRTYCRAYGPAAETMCKAIQFLRRRIVSNPAKTASDWHSRVLPWLEDPDTMRKFAADVQTAYDALPPGAAKARVARMLAASWKRLVMAYKKDPSAAAAYADAQEKYRRYAKETARTALMEPSAREKAEADVDEMLELLVLKFKDLPEELKSVPDSDLVCVDYHASPSACADDPVSERGRAVAAKDYKKMPVECGVYDLQSKDRFSFRIDAENVRPGAYSWVKLGKCHIGRDSLFWFPWSWRSTFRLKDFHVLADGMDVDPNWYELWVSARDAEGKFLVDRLAFRRVKP